MPNVDLNTFLGLANLAFILKLIFADIASLMKLLNDHLDWSTERHLKIESRLAALETLAKKSE